MFPLPDIILRHLPIWLSGVGSPWGGGGSLIQPFAARSLFMLISSCGGVVPSSMPPN